jgi:predicted MFS family arabinose efflux permease
MYGRRLIIIVLLFISLSNLIYMFFNVKMFKYEYENQIIEQIQELGDAVKKEIEYALQFGLSIETLGGMDSFLQSILENSPELVYIKILSKNNILYSASRQNEVVQEIKINILTSDSKNEKALILLGIGDELGKKIGIMFFDLITIFLAGLIIAYEIIRFFTSKLVIIPFQESISSMNKIVKNLDPDTHEKFPSEYTSFLSRLKHCVNITMLQIDDVYNKLNLVGLEAMATIFYGRGLLLKEINKKKLFLNKIVQKNYQVIKIIDPSLVRPIVFVFFLSSNLHSCFLPIFTRDLLVQDTFLTGFFSNEILMGLPITSYMLSATVFMLASGTKPFQWIRQDYAVGFATLCTSFGLFICGISENIVQLILGRMICAVGFAIVVIYCKQFIINNSSEKDRSFYLAGFNSAFAGGLFCSIIIGSIMADYFSYRFVFLSASIMILLIFFFDYMVLSKNLPIGNRVENIEKIGVLNFLKHGFNDKNLICILLQSVITRITFIGFFYYSLPIVLKADFTYSDIGRIMMFYGLPGILFASIINKRIKRIEQSKFFVVVSNLALGISFMMFNYFISGSAMHKACSVIFILLLLGISNSISFPSQLRLFLTTKTAKTIGTRTSLAVYHSVERIGSSFGPIIFGYFAACYDINMAVVLGGLLCICGNLLFMIFFNLRSSN